MMRNKEPKTFTDEYVKEILGDFVYHYEEEECQIIISTGIYRWSDGSFKDEPEPWGKDK